MVRQPATPCHPNTSTCTSEWICESHCGHSWLLIQKRDNTQWWCVDGEGEGKTPRSRHVCNQGIQLKCPGGNYCKLIGSQKQPQWRCIYPPSLSLTPFAIITVESSHLQRQPHQQTILNLMVCLPCRASTPSKQKGSLPVCCKPTDIVHIPCPLCWPISVLVCWGSSRISVETLQSELQSHDMKNSNSEEIKFNIQKWVSTPSSFSLVTDLSM